MLGGGAAELDREFLVDFSIRAEGIDRIPVIDLISGDVDQRRIEGKTVIVAAAAAELPDRFLVPVQGMIYGGVLEAIGTETVLQGRILAETGWPLAALGLLVIGALAVFASRRLRWWQAIGVLVAASIAIEFAAILISASVPLLVDTAAWHLAFFALAVLALATEIDLRGFLLTVAGVATGNSRRILDRVIADSFGGVVLVGADGVIRSASATAVRLLGYDHPHELVGGHAGSVLPPVLRDPLRAILARSEQDAADPLAWQAELGEGTHARVLDCRLTVSTMASLPAAGETEAQSVACLTFVDVTERRAGPSGGSPTWPASTR